MDTTTKVQARTITKRAKEMGIELKHTQALELLASLEGKKNREVKSTFQFKKGQNPFKEKDPTRINGCTLYSYTNLYGEVWAIYHSFKEGVIYFSGSDVNWEWVKILLGEKFTIPFILNTEEHDWFNTVYKAVIKMHRVEHSVGHGYAFKELSEMLRENGIEVINKDGENIAFKNDKGITIDNEAISNIFKTFAK